MSLCRNTKSGARRCAMLASDPVSKLSTQITRCPCASNASHRCEPRKPLPPVTRQVAMNARRIARWLSAGRLEGLLAYVDGQDIAPIRELLRKSCVGQALTHHRTLLTAGTALAALLLWLDQPLLRQ